MGHQLLRFIRLCESTTLMYEIVNIGEKKATFSLNSAFRLTGLKH